MASDGVYRVSLDEAIEAMRLTASDMSVKYKETSLSVSIPLSFLECDMCMLTWLTGSCGMHSAFDMFLYPLTLRLITRRRQLRSRFPFRHGECSGLLYQGIELTVFLFS